MAKYDREQALSAHCLQVGLLYIFDASYKKSGSAIHNYYSFVMALWGMNQEIPEPVQDLLEKIHEFKKDWAIEPAFKLDKRYLTILYTFLVCDGQDV